MKKIIILGILTIGESLLANPCFVPGKFVGIGMFHQGGGVKGAYNVASEISDSNNSTQTYETPKGKVTLAYHLEDGKLYVNGNSSPAGIVQCGMGSLNLKAVYKEDKQEIAVTEEWTQFGNYFIRSGSKSHGGKDLITYTELLIRQ